ncbi:imidazolonepropionase-like domain-containing protein [Brachybacterium sp. AOP25-B2-12]|uniref:imidazolonepropionase-like domain-containing protein n=1 Tax=Brachybacterium sp. AOP25-B2-12 TaxID=3457710 RepID=UPI004033F404
MSTPQNPAVLYTGVFVYSTQDPEASAFLVEDGTIAWIGPEDTALALHPGARREHFEGSLVTPTFVDVLPTADGSEPGLLWRTEAAARGVTDAVPGLPGMRDGVLAVAPVASPGTPYLELAGAGTPLAFGSGDAASSDPWSWVRAAAHEGPTEQRISDRAAFLAATRGGRRLAGSPHPGSLVTGAPATFVVWEPWDLTVRGQDERIQTWSTDPRARTPLLPDLADGSPRALRTVVDGVVVHEAGVGPGSGDRG